MSIYVTASILNVDTGSPGSKLVLLVLADFAREDGGSIYPSMDTVAKRACMDESTVRRNIKKLIDAGWLECEGKGFGGTKRYRIHQSGRFAHIDEKPLFNPGVLPKSPGVLPDNPLHPLEKKEICLEEEEFILPWDIPEALDDCSVDVADEEQE